MFDLQSERAFRRFARLAVRIRAGDREWLQVHACDPSTRIDDARAVTRREVEIHRRTCFSAAEVTAAAAQAGLRASRLFDSPPVRLVAQLGTRDSYGFRRSA